MMGVKTLSTYYHAHLIWKEVIICKNETNVLTAQWWSKTNVYSILKFSVEIISSIDGRTNVTTIFVFIREAKNV